MTPQNEQSVVTDALRALVDDHDAAVTVVDDDGRVRYANARARATDLVGDADADPAGEPVDTLLAPAPAADADDLLSLVRDPPADAVTLVPAADDELVPTADGDERTRLKSTITDSPNGCAITLREATGSTPEQTVEEPSGGSAPATSGDTGGEAGIGAGSGTAEAAEPFVPDVGWQRVLETTTAGIAILDEAGEYRYVNAAHAEVYGYDSPDQLVGRNWRALYDDAEVERLESEAMAAIEQEGVWRGTPTGRRRDGQPFPQALTLSSLPDGGLVCVVRDRSEQVEFQETLEALHEATRDLLVADSRQAVAEVAVEAAVRTLDLPLSGIYFHDEAQDVLEPAAWSDAVAETFDASPTFTGDDGSLAWEVFSSGEPRQFDDPDDADVLYDRETAAGGELILPLGDHGVMLTGYLEGDGFDEEAVRLARTLAASTTTALEGVTAAEALRDRNDQLERFSAMLSHDLRDPLNTAMATTSLARRTADGEVIDHLDTLDRLHTRMETLIADVLALARDPTDLDPETVALEPLVREAWKTARTATGATDATLTVEGSRIVEADATHLRRLVENLLANAARHAGDGVHVRVGLHDDGFYVADDGPGIPPTEREQVFERGHTEGGTGLGLDIVRQVARTHGWSVSVGESEAGGARFDIDTDAGGR